MEKLLLVLLLSLALSGLVSASERYKKDGQRQHEYEYDGPRQHDYEYDGPRQHEYDYDGPRQHNHWEYQMPVHKPYGHYHPVHPTPPVVPTTCNVTCVCSRELELEKLVAENGCASGSCTGTGYCTPQQVATNCGSDGCSADLGTGITTELCFGPGNLCLQATCPSDGTITLTGKAFPLQCCGATDRLFVYNGTLAQGNVLGDLSDKESVDYTTPCKQGDIFQICEKFGVIITSSVKATFISQSPNACSAGDNTLGCNPATPASP